MVNTRFSLINGHHQSSLHAFGGRTNPRSNGKYCMHRLDEVIRARVTKTELQVSDEEAELQRLLEENNRLRKAMADAALKLEPEKRKKFAEEYQQIAASATQLGLDVDQQLLKEASHESAPGHGQSQPVQAPQPPQADVSLSASIPASDVRIPGSRRGGLAVPPPAPSSFSPVASPPSPPISSLNLEDPPRLSPGSLGVSASASSTQAGPSSLDEIDSKGYLLDILNLSVDLDPDDDDDQAVSVPESSSGQVTRSAAQVSTSLSSDPSVMHKKQEKETPVKKPSVRAVTEILSEREAARKMVTSHVPDEVVANKHHWMVVLVPERPVAGEELVIYFNRNASDVLRGRPSINMLYGFNKWELKSEGCDRLNLSPSSISRNQGSDFWSCRIKVPLESYELNFVFNDGENAYENNTGKDFTFPVQGGISYDDWIDSAGDRAAKAAAIKAAAEKAAAEETERQRQEALLQQEKEKAQKKAADVKNGYEGLQKNGVSIMHVGSDPAKPVLWKVSPAEPVAGTKAKLLYNRTASPLSKLQIPQDQTLNLRYGCNGWQKPVVVQMQHDALQAEDAEWWMAELDVPFEAAAINFVINYFEHYDNNNRQDHKIMIQLPKDYTLDSWAQALEERFFQDFHEERKEAEEEAKRKEAARKAERRKAQALVREVERRKVRHVLYTEPAVVTAGEEVTVYYNPRDTSLNGRQRIFIQGGWNRWSHPRPFGPLEMEAPAAGGSHFKAVVKVPLDAYKMDFVFSDVEGGDGTYDSRGGYDYHLPVENSLVPEPGLYIAHIAVEMAPIAKVGGLGDVVTALGRAVQDQGHKVEVLLPKYQFFNSSPVLAGQLKYETEFDWGGTRVYVTTGVVEGLRVFFIEPRNGFFDTPTVYGRYDDEVRFDFFCKAALEFLLRTNRQPDILHCHDWSTAHVAKTYWDDYHPYGLWNPKVVFTIHNLNYGKRKISEAAHYCQRFTTVSPTYAYETGGNPTISSQTHKFLGIRNGIDPELWDPENNQWLPTSFTAQNVVEGKAAARKALRERIGLGGWGDKFIVGVVSRLTGQKGVPLIKHAAFRTVERGGQFVLLGSAPDPKVQAEFDQLARSYNGDVARFCFKYDEPLSHLIYAACDMIVVPSMFEPCGLTQMIAMRYGAVPVVRHTGGLKDTVFDVDFDKARAAWDVYGSSDWQRDGLDATNGFAFEGTDPGSLDYALNRAIDAWYNDRAWFQTLQKRVMEQDWSWNRPALDYIELYHASRKA